MTVTTELGRLERLLSYGFEHRSVCMVFDTVHADDSVVVLALK